MRQQKIRLQTVVGKFVVGKNDYKKIDYSFLFLRRFMQ